MVKILEAILNTEYEWQVMAMNIKIKLIIYFFPAWFIISTAWHSTEQDGHHLKYVICKKIDLKAGGGVDFSKYMMTFETSPSNLTNSPNT